MHHALQKLDVGHNELASVPSELGALARLSILLLDSNHLNVVRAAPRRTSRISRAQARISREQTQAALLFSQVPPSMAALTALRRLDLNWNPLGVADGPSLQTLRTIKQQVGQSQ
jgi:Leucine-rich repeat (LRR) protein